MVNDLKKRSPNYHRTQLNTTPFKQYARQAFRMKQIPLPSIYYSTSSKVDGHTIFGYCRQVEMLPPTLLQQRARKMPVVK